MFLTSASQECTPNPVNKVKNKVREYSDSTQHPINIADHPVVQQRIMLSDFADGLKNFNQTSITNK